LRVDFFQTVRVVYPQVVLGLGRQIGIIMKINTSRVLTFKIKERYTFRKKFQTNASVKIAANVRRNIPGIMTALTRQGLKRAVDIVKCDSLNQNDQTTTPPSEEVLSPDLPRFANKPHHLRASRLTVHSRHRIITLVFEFSENQSIKTY